MNKPWAEVRPAMVYPYPVLCDGCGALLLTIVIEDAVSDEHYETVACPSGACDSLRCLACGHEWFSVGPVDCWSCGSAPRRNPKIRRLRMAYRQRRRRTVRG